MFSVEQYGDDVVITPECDLDLASKDAFTTCLETAGRRVTGRIVVSMLHCNYVDSTALNALAVARRTLGERLILAVAPNVHVARIFSITDFHKVVPIYPTVGEALGAGA